MTKIKKSVSEFWKSLFKLCGTKISMHSAYHPESDGHTKRTNMSLEDMLRMYVKKDNSLGINGCI